MRGEQHAQDGSGGGGCRPVSLGGASMASAGEVKGTGELTPINGFQAGSICAFSGLDDGTESGLGVQPGVTQSWGQVAKGFATDGGVGQFAQAGVIHDEGPGSTPWLRVWWWRVVVWTTRSTRSEPGPSGPGSAAVGGPPGSGDGAGRPGVVPTRRSGTSPGHRANAGLFTHAQAGIRNRRQNPVMSIRRVVTGVDADGASVFVSDERVDAVAPAVMPGLVFHRVWGQDGAPVAP